MGCFLAIDGGGTRTSAWLADSEGKIRSRVEAGPSNPLKVGLRAAEREILKACRTALRQVGFRAGGTRTPGASLLRAVCAGIAGVDRQSVHRPLLAWMRRHIPARRFLLTSDAAIALAAAVQKGPGIIVIAGTGSIACARGDGGKLLRAGGWGLPYDDQGSGYELGRQAVAAALEAFDGRGPATLLLDKIRQHLHLKTITEVVSRRLEPQQIAALFPLVIAAASEGDLVALHLCEHAGRDLALLAAALLRRTDWLARAVPVITTGGVFKSSAVVRRAFVRQLQRVAPQARVELLERAPLEGALWLARTLDPKRPRR